MASIVTPNETKTPPPSSLRLLHNGQVYQRNPHWHLKICSDGSVYGEIIGPQSDFACIQSIKAQLDAAETPVMFSQAAELISRFSNDQLLPDDVLVELTESDRWCAVPPEEQGVESVVTFFDSLQKILQPYLSQRPV
jgi:hypothetical protein